MSVEYTPQFEHRDWVDQLDRVRASGEDGFNARFQAISFEFRVLAGIVGSVNDTLDALTNPPVQETTLTLTPQLLAVTGTAAWTQDGSSAVSAGRDQVAGFAPLDLPDGVRLRSFAVFGSAGPDSEMGAVLQRLPVAGGPAETIAELTVSGTGSAFSPSTTLSGATAVVVTKRFKYGIAADWNAGQDLTAAARLTAFQLVHVPA